jgi:putative transposase
VITEQRGLFGVRPSCQALGVARASYYRWQSPRTEPTEVGRHPRALSVAERQTALSVLNEERFCDQAPAEVYATLLDEGQHVCSQRTMYRILAENGQIRERRD